MVSFDRYTIRVCGSYCNLYDIDTGSRLLSYIGHSNKIDYISLHPDNTKFISYDDDGVCIMWDIESGNFIRKYDTIVRGCRHISVTSNGKQFVLINSIYIPVVFDIDTGNRINSTTDLSKIYKNHISLYDNIFISSVLLSECVLWSTTSGIIGDFGKNTDESIGCVCVFPDKKRVMIGYDNGTCILWRINTPGLARGYCCDVGKTTNVSSVRRYSCDVNKITSIAILPDEKRFIVGGSKGKCELWDTYEGHKRTYGIPGKYSIRCICIHPDGERFIAESSNDKTINIWNINTGKFSSYQCDNIVFDIHMCPGRGRFIVNSKFVYDIDEDFSKCLSLYLIQDIVTLVKSYYTTSYSVVHQF